MFVFLNPIHSSEDPEIQARRQNKFCLIMTTEMKGQFSDFPGIFIISNNEIIFSNTVHSISILEQ